MINSLEKFGRTYLWKTKLENTLTYAIGEIVLVVIGILIALWINNKNQEYNNVKIARTYLEDFKRDLEADINTLEKNIIKNEIFIKNADSIIIASQKEVLSENENNSFFGWVNSLMGETYYVPEKTTIRQFESSNSSHLITS